MERLILNYIESLRKKRFDTEDLERHLIHYLKKEYESLGGYIELARIMHKLEEEELVKRVRSRGVNSMSIPLANCYQKTSMKASITENQKKQLLLRYHPKMIMNAYLKDYSLFEKDQFYLDNINQFLYRHDKDEISINERSFELFNDEKWLISDHASKVLQRVSLKLEDFHCYFTYEPFFYYKAKISGNQKKLNILIVENKDTFFTLKALMLEGISTYCNTKFEILIYGEGKKILRSIYFLREIDEIQNMDWEIYYFGDIDPEGLYIYSRLEEIDFITVKPFIPLYKELMIKNADKAPKRKKLQRNEESDYQLFLNHLSSELKESVLNIIDNEGYLPQEGLSKTVFKELAARKEERWTN